MRCLDRARGPVVCVSNEVGLGIVPGHQTSGREFRDAAGRLNQHHRRPGRPGRVRRRRAAPHPEERDNMNRIPATVVTGFLGAGKTSLIRHLLENANGRNASH